ncbi:MAG: hypothetical protein M0C28_23390 [Candidatus Moduliflexus flocculans]|nr:hypothetical protein [Candidatus Moduliflexus flocculans]
MKALVLEEYKRFAYRDVPDPDLGDPGRDRPGQGRGDLRLRRPRHGRLHRPPHDPRSSWATRPRARSSEAGADVRRFRVGDRVTFDSTEYCGRMLALPPGRGEPLRRPPGPRRLLRGVPARRGLRGVRGRAGAHPLPLPEGLVHSSGLPRRSPLAVAAHAACSRLALPGESLAVVGAGLIGLLLIQVLRASTRRGPSSPWTRIPAGRAQALKLGADLALDPADPGRLDGTQALDAAAAGADRACEAVGVTPRGGHGRRTASARAAP